MENSKIKSLTDQVQLLLKTNKDFAPILKKRLVLESNSVKNPFQFIVGLFNEGVLCDGSSDQEADFGLKEMIVQLVMMITCTKGPDAIGGLIKALDESGNSQLVSALHTWIKKDYTLETDGKPTVAKAEAAAWPAGPSDEIPNYYMASKMDTSLSGAKLMGMSSSHMEKVLTEQIKASSKRAVESLVLALVNTNNERFLVGTNGYLETSPATKNNYPIAVKSLANQPSKQVSAAGKSTFFEQAAASDKLSKVATLKCQQRSSTKGILRVQFDTERMMACCAQGSLNLWSWRDNEEESIKVAVQVKGISCFEYDQDIFIVGTGTGAIHLFDARTFEEKWSVRLGEHVISLKFAESTLVVITQNDDIEQLWWIDISRPDMRLLNQRPMYDWKGHESLIPGIYVCPDTSFINYNDDRVNVHDTKSGAQIEDDDDDHCYLTAPDDISSLAVGDLVSGKKVVVAGCIDGMIVVWNTCEFLADQRPVKTFQGHTETVVSLCTFNGHLLSLDENGKLLMWSGYDLENTNISAPVPRLLLENPDVERLATHKRWFASFSSEHDIINIWTFPDLWLRTG